MFTPVPEIKINFEMLDDIYSESVSSYKELLDKIFSEYNLYKADILSAIEKGDLETYRKIKHKISASLGLLQLQDLLVYLELIKDNFPETKNNFLQIESSLQNCFEEIYSQIRTKISSLK
jgi:L-ribulose-5-phosphate 3-epimerase UlaE